MIRYRDFADLVNRMSASNPEKEALLVYQGAGGVRAFSWAEFAALVQDRADDLAGHEDACEAILVDGSLESVVEVFAAVKAGLQVVLVDPLIPNEVMEPLLHSVDASRVWARGANRQIALEKSLKPGAVPAYGAHGVLFFTSGTTSLSKAVVLTDESLMASAYNGASLMPLAQEDTLLCMLPLSHVFGFVCGLLWGLACGASVALGRGARYYVDDLVLFEPTAVALVPKLLEFLVAREALNEDLKLVLVGAADCKDSLLDTIRQRGIRASLGYGLTETSSGLALSCGDDFHAMTVCPDDTVTIAEDGEILVSAPTCIMQGYYRDAEKTALTIRDGILHTGDRGFFDDYGLLHVQGRLKDVITLSSGTKVYVPEYEEAIREALGEQDIAVILNQGQLMLVCGSLACEFSESEIMKSLERAMSKHPPSSRIAKIVCIGHALPRTAAGDVERWKIQEELKHGNC